jgi:hypothetical protein
MAPQQPLLRESHTGLKQKYLPIIRSGNGQYSCCLCWGRVYDSLNFHGRGEKS